MDERDLEREREAAVKLLTSAYVRDLIDMEKLEDRLQQVAAANSSAGVRSVLGELGETRVEPLPMPLDPDFPEAQQLVRGSFQTVRREGLWLRSRRVVVIQTGSSVRLDLSQIAGRHRERFEVELVLKGSSCRILVPYGTRVDEQLESHASSFGRARRLVRREEVEGPLLVIRGRVTASSVRVAPVRERGRPRLLR